MFTVSLFKQAECRAQRGFFSQERPLLLGRFHGKTGQSGNVFRL
jgi:hypothetical protein